MLPMDKSGKKKNLLCCETSLNDPQPKTLNPKPRYEAQKLKHDAERAKTKGKLEEQVQRMCSI